MTLSKQGGDEAAIQLYKALQPDSAVKEDTTEMERSESHTAPQEGRQSRYKELPPNQPPVTCVQDFYQNNPN